MGWRLVLRKRQKGWMLSVRAARGVGHGSVLGCRLARGREHPALSASQPPAGEAQDTAGQDGLRLSARACGCAGLAEARVQLVASWGQWQ